MTTNMKAINLPLLVLFGLCYALGHPALAAYRPVLVDKTLASFHEDVNRTIAGSSISVAKLFEPVPVPASALAPTPGPALVESTVITAAPLPQVVEQPRRLAELPRQRVNGFTELMAR
ncbi:MAG: hypothetical protein ACRDBL_03030 [Rhabdaerophilum sp.]